MKFDFILFENAYNIENHYKDLSMSASLLSKMGYSVAIADVFKEEELCRLEDIPHIKLKLRCPQYFSTLSKFRKPVSGIRFHFNRILQGLYLIYAIFALRNKAKNFYIGSLTSYTPLLWLYFLSPQRNYFIWGLRSNTLEVWRQQSFNSFTISSFLIERRIKNCNRIKVVVSNEIIRQEFIKLGIAETRIVVKPERWIVDKLVESPRVIHNKKYKLNLLTIGTLRKSKHVEFVLQSLQELNDNEISYTIAGRCRDANGYEEMISQFSQGVPNVVRKNYFIDESEYETLLSECDFLVLCDEPELSCASNGTMAEAMIMGIPIIAPNHNPFKYEVERYDIGLLYDFYDIKSLANVLLKAKSIGPRFFSTNISRYQETIREKNVIVSMKEQLNNILQ